MLRGGIGLFIAPFQVQGVPGIQTAVNQTGYSRSTPVPVTSDNGLTFQANLVEPGAERAVARSCRVEPGAHHQSGQCARQRDPQERTNPEYWRYSFGIERQFPGDFLIEVSYLGQKGSHLPILETLNYVPQQFRTQNPIRDVAAENLPQPGGRESICRPDAGRAGEQRLANQPAPAAASTSAVRRERHLHRKRHVLRRNRRRLQHVSRDDLPRGQALQPRVHGDELVHVVAHARARHPAEPLGGTGRARRRGRSAASHHVCVGGRAAAGPRPPMGQRLEWASSMRFSAAGSLRPNTSGRPASRWCSTTTRITTRPAAIPNR